MFLRDIHHGGDALSTVLRSQARGNFEVAVKRPITAIQGRGRHFFRSWHRQQIGIGMLHLRQRFGRLYYATQAVTVVLVCAGARRTVAEGGAHRNVVLLFRDVLMNRIVGKARERAASAGNEQLDLVCL